MAPSSKSQTATHSKEPIHHIENFKMHSMGRAFSALTLKPDIGNQKDESPYVNERGYVDFKSGDTENPRNWSQTRRWIITLIAVLLALNGNFSSSIFAASLDSVIDEFNVSEVAAALTTTLFLLGFCVGPFIFAPLSEFYGRRWIFYIKFAA